MHVWKMETMAPRSPVCSSLFSCDVYDQGLSDGVLSTYCHACLGLGSYHCQMVLVFSSLIY